MHKHNVMHLQQVHAYLHVCVDLESPRRCACFMLAALVSTVVLLVRTSLYVYSYTRTSTHTYVRTYLLTHTHACMHTYMYTYIHTYIHTYICVYRQRQGSMFIKPKTHTPRNTQHLNPYA